MRPIKFLRAWHLRRKEWHYFTLTDLILGRAEQDTLWYEYWCKFTGLRDVNGRDIYDGDIVADRDTSDCVFAVQWDEEKAGYYMPPEFDEEYAYSIAAVKLEVIGNIYENPDLIPIEN